MAIVPHSIREGVWLKNEDDEWVLDHGSNLSMLEEAASSVTANKPKAPVGLKVDLLDMEKFVRINNLQPCTNPIFLDRNIPTEDGVLSYKIFGTSQQERKNRMAYIDLAPYHYMTPLAATKLSTYDRTMSRCLLSQGRFKIVDGTLVEDPENGDSGPEFLYKNWGKIKVHDKDTTLTKEVQKFFEQDRNILFLTKYPVIPAFYRDLNPGASGSNGGSKSADEINFKYSSLIAYTQTLNNYTDTFTNMSRLTQSRIQGILMEIYKTLMVENVKGQPSKFGMLRRTMQGKNVNYAARLVLSSPILMKDSYEDVMVKFGYVVLPLAYCLSCFFPFMVHSLKRYFDMMFIEGGKVPVMKDGKLQYMTYGTSFDENEITKMITRYLNSPSNRFDLVMTPPDQDGKTHPMVIVGRFNKSNTTVARKATLTDILYIVAHQVVQDKHVFITRYPLDNYNGQWPAKIEIASTIRSEPAIIGETMYQFYPICEGDPSNAFVDTLQFSNTMLGPMGGDKRNHVVVSCNSDVVRITW